MQSRGPLSSNSTITCGVQLCNFTVSCRTCRPVLFYYIAPLHVLLLCKLLRKFHSPTLLCFGQFPRYSRAWASSPWVAIFIGLVKHGAWGCFDEFKCLEEAMLSEVSIQIQPIQDSIWTRLPTTELLGREVGCRSCE